MLQKDLILHSEDEGDARVVSTSAAALVLVDKMSVATQFARRRLRACTVQGFEQQAQIACNKRQPEVTSRLVIRNVNRQRS
jgi:hypothetical protein